MKHENSQLHFGGVGIEIDLNGETFLTIKESLTRIGVESKRDKTLYQSCHILHKRGRYAIVHFKELFALDGNDTDISENDYGRRNKIVTLLQEWDLLTINDERWNDEVDPLPMVGISQIKIISHRDKSDWNLQQKYNIGKK